MNNKHLACVLLGVVIALLGYVTLTIQGKATDMQQQAETAKSNADAAGESRRTHQNKFTKRQNETASLRSFLNRWEPSFAAISNVDVGTKEIDNQVRLGQLTSLSGRVQEQSDNKLKGNYLASTIRGNFTFEDEYAKCINWLGRIEKDLPTSRIWHCRIGKGQRADDIKMEVILDLPLVKGEPKS
ncbi:MAG: hypothetical protein KDN22_14340 [Verrucomicrobiae bacterium]|nr:hypothetical protein [Verrucomicrobiae bacterium]